MSVLIPVGNNSASSADIPLAEGETATLFLMGALPGQVPLDANALIQAKEGADYFTIGQLDGSDPAVVLNATGTFRVHRPGCRTPFGVARG